MNEDNIAYLQSEIDRLNRIIVVLLDQNEELKKEIALLKTANGNIDFNNAALQNQEGNINSESAILKSENGNTNLYSAVTENQKGNINLESATPKSEMGNTKLQEPLPAFLPISEINMNKVAKILKQQDLKKVSFKTAQKTAKMFLHFHNNGNSSYKELCKITGHSNYGLAKYIRSLKKRGLIIRTGFQRFILSEHAAQLLQQAGCKS